MKKYVSIVLSSSVLAACNTTAVEPEPQVDMANPASEYCIQQGGKLEPRKNAHGEYAMCHLPDGRVIEEWEFFRANHK